MSRNTRIRCDMLRYARGVTLIELMITISVLALLITLALPSYRNWIQNTQIRTAGEAIHSGMQLARAEAVRRNTTVQLVMGASTDWTVSVATAGGPGEQIQARPAADSPNATITVTPAGATTVTFSGLGRVAPNFDGSNSMQQIDINTSVTIDSPRPLRVALGTAGNTRFCDPAVAAPDPRACF